MKANKQGSVVIVNMKTTQLVCQIQTVFVGWVQITVSWNRQRVEIALEDQSSRGEISLFIQTCPSIK